MKVTADLKQTATTKKENYRNWRNIYSRKSAAWLSGKVCLLEQIYMRTREGDHIYKMEGCVQESSNLQKGLGILVGEHLNIGTRVVLLQKDYVQSLSRLV